MKLHMHKWLTSIHYTAWYVAYHYSKPKYSIDEQNYAT